MSIHRSPSGFFGSSCGNDPFRTIIGRIDHLVLDGERADRRRAVSAHPHAVTLDETAVQVNHQFVAVQKYDGGERPGDDLELLPHADLAGIDVVQFRDVFPRQLVPLADDPQLVARFDDVGVVIIGCGEKYSAWASLFNCGSSFSRSAGLCQYHRDSSFCAST